jgi:hypothetical protein
VTTVASDLTSIISLCIQFFLLLTAIVGFGAARRAAGRNADKQADAIAEVHGLVNNQLDRQLDRNAELTATLTAAGVDVPEQAPAEEQP